MADDLQQQRKQCLYQKLRDLSVRGGPCGLLRVHVCIRNMLAIAAKLTNNNNKNKSNKYVKHRNNYVSFAG